MAKLVMGYWDCPFCGAKGVQGDKANCPSCGRARGEVKFYMKDYQEGEIREANQRGDVEYVGEEKAQSFSKNPDWYCSFCNSLNSDNADTCGNCGSSRSASEANYFEMLKKKQQREAANAAARPQQPQAKPSRRPLIILAALVLVIIGAFMWMNGNKTSGDLLVTGLNWTRTIDIEENRVFSESGWDLPEGAEETSSKRELHHYDRVLDHYENVEVQRTRQVIDHYETYYTYTDNGNGTYTEVPHERPVYTTETYTETERQPIYRQVARYATKHYYNIRRWVYARAVTAEGQDHSVNWPEVSLGENEREGERHEAYRFTVENQKKKEAPATYSVDESTWNQLNTGDMVFITTKNTGATPFLSDEKGNKIAELTREQ